MVRRLILFFCSGGVRLGGGKEWEMEWGEKLGWGWK